VIFQLEDDHSRVAVASHVADAETSEGALAVFDKGVAARGVPQRLLTDNGIALNPHRRGWVGQLAAHAASLGVEAITGKPYHPQTQGKNERFHQTLFRWLDKQPLAHTLQELQAQVDDFDRVYNTQRPHQGLPGRLTPQQAWDATPPAPAPRPQPAPTDPPVPRPMPTSPQEPRRARNPHPRRFPEKGTREITVGANGTVSLRGVNFVISHPLAGHVIHAAWDTHGVTFADSDAIVLIEHNWPPHRRHLRLHPPARGHNQPRRTTPQEPPPHASDTEVLRHRMSPKS